MKIASLPLFQSAPMLVLLLLVWSTGCGKNLEGQIQEQVRTLDNANLDPDSVEVTSIRETGDHAVAEVTIKTAVKMRKVDNVWVIDEVRLAGGRWEKVDRILRALNLQREEETKQQMEQVRQAIEQYRAREGQIPRAATFAALIDTLAPQDLATVIRIDAWWNIFFYRAFSSDRYEIRSTGPDGHVYTDDDLVVEG